MSRSRIVADASPLIGLDRAGHLRLIPALFDGLVAPPAVIAEFGRQPDWLGSVHIERPSEVLLLRAIPFGAGEAEALAVALSRPGSTVLLDEKRARRFAEQRGITIVGTAGLVLRSKQRGFIPAVRPVLDDLRGTGFRLSDALRDAVLARAGEV